MIIVKYAEIAIKGKNRVDFERKLRENIKDCIKRNNIPFEKVRRMRGRILIYTDKECPQLKNVFGIASFSYAKRYSQDLQTIKEEALKLYKKGTFKVFVKRSDKVLKNSMELAAEIGAYIIEKTNAPVDIKNPETKINVELFNHFAYLYTETNQGAGGLPVGSDSNVILLLQNKDSIEAGLRILKRGCSLDVYKEKDIGYSKLKEYEYGFRIKELEKMPENPEAVIVSDKIDSIKDYPYFVLRPLI